MTAVARCATHRVPDRRGVHTAALPLPACERSTQYGVWDEGAGGFVYVADCATDAGNWAVEVLIPEDPDVEMAVKAVCPDHEEQPAATCEDCYRDQDDSP
ncbi:hypothetical protein ABZ352_18730 [Streptomyces griseofuscus]|uniref:hypothetical protein n=1 Tax=Streptomyces griseofuscus TaxID=146922 RepID=UPI00340AFD4B